MDDKYDRLLTVQIATDDRIHGTTVSMHMDQYMELRDWVEELRAENAKLREAVNYAARRTARWADRHDLDAQGLVDAVLRAMGGE